MLLEYLILRLNLVKLSILGLKVVLYTINHDIHSLQCELKLKTLLLNLFQAVQRIAPSTESLSTSSGVIARCSEKLALLLEQNDSRSIPRALSMLLAQL